MKKARLQRRMTRVLLAAAMAGGLWLLRSRTADSFLEHKALSGVSLLYNDIEGGTAGACPLIERGQPEMEELSAILRTLRIRWCGVSSSGMEVPGYHLAFCDEQGMPRVTMYVTSAGDLYCGGCAYRVLAPGPEEAWARLGQLYRRAALLQP